MGDLIINQGIKLEMDNQGIKFKWPFTIKLEMIDQGIKVQVTFCNKVRNDKSGNALLQDLSIHVTLVYFKISES
jgi:hypothetical protein